MANSTSNTYQMKREILSFLNKSSKSVYKKGYRVTEATVLTNNQHPVSIFSKIHSSAEKNFYPSMILPLKPSIVELPYLTRLLL